MSEQTNRTGNDPGWAPDPSGRHQLRFWDGARWTDHVNDGGVPGVDPVAAPPDVRRDAKPIWKRWWAVAAAVVAVLVGLGALMPQKQPTKVSAADITATTVAPAAVAPTTVAPPATTAPVVTAPPVTAPPVTSPPATSPRITAPPRPVTTAAPVPDAYAGETVSQANARRKAASYLEFTSFSRTGLIGQLKFDGFSEPDATYGVDAQHADWFEQAAKKAESYMEFTSFSRQGLIDQLMFDGFSQPEAEHGADAVGLNA
ncbi:MAG TPA: Ltp family lipoprotein [Acidimicrobiales bacterium]|nr:Ltp family lipoprotein [Acidimicrobiales bacterium]